MTVEEARQVLTEHAESQRAEADSWTRGTADLAINERCNAIAAKARQTAEAIDVVLAALDAA